MSLENSMFAAIFGCPTEAETTVLAISATSTGEALEANEVYRLIASKNMHISIQTGEVDATTAAPYMAAGVPEVFSTTGRNTRIHAIRATEDGNLYITKMLNRGV